MRWQMLLLIPFVMLMSCQLSGPTDADGNEAGSVTAGGAPPPAAHRMQPDHAPTPFSAEQIRDGSRAGTWNKYRMVLADKPGFDQIMTFVWCDEAGARVEIVNAGLRHVAPGDARKFDSTWRDFQAHASYPEKQTLVETVYCETPIGEFKCWLYTVADKTDAGVPTVERAWFAQVMPGPPVVYEYYENGELMLRKTLVDREW